MGTTTGSQTASSESPRDVLEFGILGPSGHAPTIGANRNVILLQTAGELVLSIDDDTICTPCAVPESNMAKLLLGSEGDPTEIWFFGNRESAIAFACPTDVDIASAHEALLGRQISTLVPPAPNSDVDLKCACGHIIQSIWMGTGRVLITLNGLAGDSGMVSGKQLMLREEPGTRQRLIGSKEQYRLALKSREIVRQALSAVVCHAGPFMGAFFGMDNRALLPPFLPVGRNEDATFGYIISRCLEGGYFGYLPWSLVHAPPPGRSYSDGAASIRISDLVMACVSTWTSLGGITADAKRLRSLGSHLVEITSLRPADFDEYIRILLWQHAGQLIAHKEAVLQHYGDEPAFWAEDLRREIDAMRMAAAQAGYAAPIDLATHFSGAVRLREAQAIIRRYGDLIYLWPDIMERAKELSVLRVTAK